MEKVLVIAAHPDDEVLGCGATIAKHKAKGDYVEVVIVGTGIGARDGLNANETRVQLEQLETASKRANKCLGVDNLRLLGLPDNRLDGMQMLDLIKILEVEIRRVQPGCIYTHHGGDVNIDHRRITEAVLTCTRPLPGSSIKRISSFEVCSSSEWGTNGCGYPFDPNFFNEVSMTAETKIRALEIYGMEMREFPHARSIEAVRAQLVLRGAQCGVDRAEAFRLIRCIE